VNTANWLQLLGTIVLLAVTWGGVQARLKQVEKQSEKTSDDLNKSRSDQGGRIGILADRLSTLEGAFYAPAGPQPIAMRPRSRTRPIAAVPEEEDSP
jgi:hypothetical protein